MCATGDGGGRLRAAVQQTLDKKFHDAMQVIEGVDFVDIEDAAKAARPELVIGHSKGYSLSRKLGIPLVRIGFPIHDRTGGSRLLHVGYRGALALLDRIANTLIAKRQSSSAVGYIISGLAISNANSAIVALTVSTRADPA